MPTLLVIDDEPSILHFFRRAFAGPEIQLETATSAKEGLDKVVQLQPDVIVLDFSLPSMDGLKVAVILHEVVPSAPIILFRNDSSCIHSTISNRA